MGLRCTVLDRWSGIDCSPHWAAPHRTFPAPPYRGTPAHALPTQTHHLPTPSPIYTHLQAAAVEAAQAERDAYKVSAQEQRDLAKVGEGCRGAGAEMPTGTGIHSGWDLDSAE